MRTLVVATRNEGKLRELARLLEDLPFQVRSLRDYPHLPPVPEEGSTYAENAVRKALAVAQATGEIALADDSGLEVDALGGDPGVYSARLLGENATDAERNAEILRRLAGVPWERRTARYRAVVAVALPDGTVRTFEGTCEGRIALAPRGSEGFGYDPIFYVPDLGRTVAELEPHEKDRISHRGKAMARAREFLRSLAG
ncbi:MAG: XTP/dITP diphosphatase [Armatimonadetes bacterium]|nr:XTP/dITP diphosphatase [Armatimonadota bacterium]MDW8154147.1 XTP/dITP diphosphatase [Armatimonadota bacterium]